MYSCMSISFLFKRKFYSNEFLFSTIQQKKSPFFKRICRPQSFYLYAYIKLLNRQVKVMLSMHDYGTCCACTVVFWEVDAELYIFFFFISPPPRKRRTRNRWSVDGGGGEENTSGLIHIVLFFFLCFF